MDKKKDWIIVRGAGDLATGVIHRLAGAGFKVLALETAHPAAIRRQVSFCEAVYEGCSQVEDRTARLIHKVEEAQFVYEQGEIPLMVDPDGESIHVLKPAVVVDAIIAKKNLGTHIGMAPMTIALGPGFSAPEDVMAVVETSRGHNLGRIIRKGTAKPNTGVPGMIGGYGKERVMHSPCVGIFRNLSRIGDLVEKGQSIAYVEMPEGKVMIEASLTGILRGLLRDGYPVTEHFKIADIDPRKEELANCFTISDKSRSIAGSVLELVCSQL